MSRHYALGNRIVFRTVSSFAVYRIVKKKKCRLLRNCLSKLFTVWHLRLYYLFVIVIKLTLYLVQ
jgi:hypothetical protein